MDSFLIAVNAVLPMFLLIALGIVLRRLPFMRPQIADGINSLAFKVLLPALLFNNIYGGELSAVVRPRLIVYCLAGTVVIWLISILITHLAEKGKSKRGALIQGMYRSNFIIFGLPIVINLFGSDKVAVTSFMIAVIVPLFNLLAVITLEIYSGRNTRIGSLLLDILKNPLIISSVIGFLFMMLQIPLPGFISVTIGNIAGTATPIALIILGAMLQPHKIKDNYSAIGIALAFRLLIAPLITIPLAVLLGFRGVELATILAIFASPTAVSSFVMAKQMGGDGDLAGQIVVFSTLFSCITVFLWVFGTHSLSLL
jgi:predicted permease